MSLNTLETSYSNGQIIDASHVNELTLSLLGQFVGRNSSGVPTQGQSLGTLSVPWGNVYANGLILNGQAVDTSSIVSKANRVVSGQTRPLSSLPDFLRANGAATEFTILGSTTDLVLSINNAAVSVNSDIVKTGVVTAPAANNTADVNDTSMVNDKFAGEKFSKIETITIDNAGTEITSRIGEIAAFQTPAGEIIQAFIKSATELIEVKRGYYFNSAGDPIGRDNLSDNDVLTLLNIGWVFIEDNGVTVDITYNPPAISYQSPGSPATGDYWFDISNQVWKRYSGVTFEVIDRILIGQVVSDSTNCIASRSWDFSNPFSEFNNIEIQINSTEILESSEESTRCSIYGTSLDIDLTKLSWNITTDLASGLIEAADTDYYLYLSDEGQTVLDEIKPQFRKDLKGHYHPHESWRCVGVSHNDTSSDLVIVDDVRYNSELRERRVIFKESYASGTNSAGTSTTYQDRTINTKEGDAFGRIESGDVEMLILPGIYELEANPVAGNVNTHRAKLVNVTDSVDEILGMSKQTTTGTTVFVDSTIKGRLVFDKTKKLKIQHWVQSGGVFKLGSAMGIGDDETFNVVDFKKKN